MKLLFSLSPSLCCELHEEGWGTQVTQCFFSRAGNRTQFNKGIQDMSTNERRENIYTNNLTTTITWLKRRWIFMLRGNNIWIPIWKIRKAGLGRKESPWYIYMTSSAHTFCLILLNLLSSLFSLLSFERDFHQLCKVIILQKLYVSKYSPLPLTKALFFSQQSNHNTEQFYPNSALWRYSLPTWWQSLDGSSDLQCAHTQL